MTDPPNKINQFCDSRFPSSSRLRWLSQTVLPACLLIALTGCGDGRPARITVSGRVLIDGKPLTIGLVQFVPKGARPSAGQLDQDGRFTLTCYDRDDGIVPGIHRVTVAAKEMLPDSKVRWHAPPKYADFRKSGLSFEITEPTDDLTIELTWDGGKPFVQ